MSDVKDDSVFVLKLTLIIGGFFMVFFSKLGYYLILLMQTVGFYFILHYFFKMPFWIPFRNTIIINSVLFELYYPRFDNFTQSTYLEVREEYDKAKDELKRRRAGVNIEQ